MSKKNENPEIPEPAAPEEIVSGATTEKRTLHCVADGKAFQVTIPAKAKVTFAPWAPSDSSGRYAGDHNRNRGTLRVYANAGPGASMIFVKSGVSEFRELEAVEYEEETEEFVGSRVWKSDKYGHVMREEVRKTPNSWDKPSQTALPDASI